MPRLFPDDLQEEHASMKVTSHKQGTPSWFDLSTSDDAAAVQFYGALFGWQDDPRPMPEGGAYHMQQIDGDDAAAISLQQPDEAAQGIPPHWNVYITVDDVDAVAGKVEAAGGSVMAPPFDVLEAGRMAVITDPTGGIVCLWQAKDSIGAERIREHGSPTWAELITREPERAAKFFADLLGVQVETTAMPEGETYTLLKVDGQEVAGVFKPGSSSAMCRTPGPPTSRSTTSTPRRRRSHRSEAWSSTRLPISRAGVSP
jgi:predicted enzyme related to lactoylglutathione lyase